MEWSGLRCGELISLMCIWGAGACIGGYDMDEVGLRCGLCGKMRWGCGVGCVVR